MLQLFVFPMKLLNYSFLVCFLVLSESGALAQQRVVYPNKGGLTHPAATQINEGTISPSARGGDRNSFGLPPTPHGPNVRAGDVSRSDLNHVNNQRANQNQSSTRTRAAANSRSNSQGNLLRSDVPQVNPNLPAAPIGPNVRAGDISRSDLHPRPSRPHSGYRHVTNPGLPAAPIGPHMRAGDIDRSDLHPHRFDSNQKFWKRGQGTTTRHTTATPSYQPPTATYKNIKTTQERF
jgi:hypothetical protein